MDELSELALAYGSDKYGHHFYTPIYYDYLKHLKNSPLSLLEIGVGGYSIPLEGGHGLRMWNGFFQNAKIYGLDIHDKSFMNKGRIRVFVGSQTDEEILRRVVEETGPLDIIVDDGSHINSHVIKSFEYLWSFLKAGGFYFVEDCHTSYWDEIATDGTDFEGGNHAGTSMNYFKQLADSVNFEHSNGRIFHKLLPDLQSIAFHKELICLKKSPIITT
jgi:cephalosporin hydroxylase